jgi:hypothetical protein
MHIFWRQLVDANLGKHEVFGHFEKGLGHDIFLLHLPMGIFTAPVGNQFVRLTYPRAAAGRPGGGCVEREANSCLRHTRNPEKGDTDGTTLSRAATTE